MSGVVIILAPSHSFGSIVTAMLGQHPAMIGMPELNLAHVETMREREGLVRRGMLSGAGLLRAVAQLWGGKQTTKMIGKAQRWVDLRRDRAGVAVLREIVEKVGERIMVEHSPGLVGHVQRMQRVRRAFPEARFLHVLRHPRPQGVAVAAAVRAGEAGDVALELGTPDRSTTPPVRDVQRAWFTFQSNVCAFLDGLPKDQWLRVRGEDLLADPGTHLPPIATWLGLRVDAAAIEAMRHPERSPFACVGPPEAAGGWEAWVLRNARLRPFRIDPTLSLQGPLPWRPDGRGFSPELIQLATELGYE
jgi:hypothetical protein